jgi:hypothetical protein
MSFGIRFSNGISCLNLDIYIVPATNIIYSILMEKDTLRLLKDEKDMKTDDTINNFST